MIRGIHDDDGDDGDDDGGDDGAVAAHWCASI